MRSPILKKSNRSFGADHPYVKDIEGYIKGEHPYALPIFDMYGLDHDGRPYFDDSPLKEDVKARIALEYVIDRLFNTDKISSYGDGPVSGGIRAVRLIARYNESKGFTPGQMITSTHKMANSIGADKIKKEVTDPNVQANLQRGTIMRMNKPDMYAAIPVKRELTISVTKESPDFSRGRGYEDPEFMAVWFPRIDLSDGESHEWPQLYSRNTIHEIMRGIQIQAGLHPLRPEADMHIHDLNHNDVDLLDIYKHLFEVAKVHVAYGLEPRDSATALVQFSSIIQNISGEDGIVSKARQKAGMRAFPEKIHPQLQNFLDQHTEEFSKLAKEVDHFIKQHCLYALTKIEEMEPRYKRWLDEGHSNAPPNIAPDKPPTLETGLNHSISSLKFIDQKIKSILEKDTLSIDELRDITNQTISCLTHMQNAANTEKLYQWKTPYHDILKKVADSHNILTQISTEHFADYDTKQCLKDVSKALTESANELGHILNDDTYTRLRSEAESLMETAYTQENKSKAKLSRELVKRPAQTRYDPTSRPFDPKFEPGLYNDKNFERCTERFKAGLPFIVAAKEICDLPPSNPLGIYVYVNPKTYGATGKSYKDQGTKRVKSIFSNAGEKSGQITAAGQKAVQDIVKYTQKTWPGEFVHSNADDSFIHAAMAHYSNFIVKEGPAIPNPLERLCNIEKTLERRDHRLVMGHGWEKSEEGCNVRLHAVLMQMNQIERAAESRMEIYSLPENLAQAPANPEADSLYESLEPLAALIEECAHEGIQPPKDSVLTFMRLINLHNMFIDIDYRNRCIPYQDKQSVFEEIEPSLSAYLLDSRRAKANAICDKFCNPKNGLLYNPLLVSHLPKEKLQAVDMGPIFKDIQKSALGMNALNRTIRPDDTLTVITPGIKNG